MLKIAKLLLGVTLFEIITGISLLTFSTLLCIIPVQTGTLQGTEIIHNE